MTQGELKINQFYTFLQSVERKRSDKFKAILKQANENLQNCGYKQSYQIQFYLENKILHFNQMMLTNLREYKELQNNVTAVFNTDAKYMLYEISLYEEKWRDICIKEIIRRLKEFGWTDEDIEQFLADKNRSVRDIINSLEELLNAMHTNTPRNPLEDFINETRHILLSLEQSAEQLIEIYRQIAKQFCEDSYLFCENILFEILDEIIEITSKHNSTEEVVKELEYKLSKSELNNDLADIEEFWKDKLEFMLKVLYERNKIINILVKLWTEHRKRVLEINELAGINVQQTILKNDKLLLNKHEMTLNIAIDTMRQEYPEGRLQKSLQKVNKALNKIKTIISKHKEVELKVAQKVYKFSDDINAIFIRELTQFLAQYSEEVQVEDDIADASNIKIQNVEKNIYIDVDYPKNYEDMDENENYVVVSKVHPFLVDALDKCETQMAYLDFSKTKLWNFLQSFIESFEEKQKPYVEDQVAEFEKKITEKCNMKIELHAIRFERIKMEIYDIRFAEIKKHQDYAKAHKYNTEASVTDLTENLKKFEESASSTMEISINKIKETYDNIKHVTNSLQAELTIEETRRMSNAASAEVQDSFKNYHDSVIEKIDQLLLANFEFLKNIKLFSEGGNFHPKEAGAFSKQLVTLESRIQKSSFSIVSKLNSIEKILLKQYSTESHKFDNISQPIYKSFKFRESSSTLLTKLQNEIKKEVYVMKYKRKEIDIVIAETKKKLQENINNNFSYAGSVMKYGQNLIAHCYEYRVYLEDADTPSTIILAAEEKPIEDTPRKDTKPKAKGTNKHTTKSIATEKHKVVEMKDYTGRLFIIAPIKNDDQFLPKISHILFKQLIVMQKLAFEFYSNTSTTDMETKIDIPENYDLYMIDILETLKYYYMQCAEVWLIEIKDFLKLEAEMRILLTQFCIDYVLDTHSKQMYLLKANNEQYFKNVDKTRKACIHLVQSVHNELKPLHGYPGNKLLLEKLQTKMNTTITKVEIDFIEFVKDFNKEQKSYVVEYVETMTTTKKISDEYKVMINEENPKLLEQAKKFIATINSDKFQFTIAELTNIYINENNAEAAVEENSNTRNEESDEINLETMSQEFDDILVMKRQEISEIKFNFTVDLRTRKTVWEADLVNVLNLYKMKYD